MRVLIVEDEERLNLLLARGLRREGFAVDQAHDGEAGLHLARLHDYEAVVLDRDIPVLHGDDLCRELLALDPTPRVLMLTAAGGVEDRVEGLGIGADDYLAKPFSFRELVARLRALGRRPARSQSPVLSRAGILLDPSRRTATRDGQGLTLRPREFAVLEELMRADGVPLGTEELLTRVWDANADPFSNPVRQTIRRLRLALGEPSPIETVPGAGYRIP